MSKLLTREQMGLGRIPKPDPRDQKFPVRHLLQAARRPAKLYQTWGDNRWRGNQGGTPQCFPAGTMVTMIDGSEKPIEKINAGEFVITHEGRPRMVQAVIAKRHVGELVKTFVRGSHYPLLCTPDH